MINKDLMKGFIVFHDIEQAKEGNGEDSKELSTFFLFGIHNWSDEFLKNSFEDLIEDSELFEEYCQNYGYELNDFYEDEMDDEELKINLMKEFIIEQGKRFHVEINHDSGSESPRTLFDNLSTFITSHGRYTIGDRQFDSDNYSSWEEVRENEIPKGAIVFDVYMYEHGGRSFKLSKYGNPFSCQWDSGKIGFMYITKEDAIKEYGEINEDTLEKIERVFKSELKEYEEWAEGNVFGYTLYEVSDIDGLAEYLVDCGYTEEDIEDLEYSDIDEYYEEVDSCWGFYGMDFDKNGMKEHLPKEVRHLCSYENINY